MSLSIIVVAESVDVFGCPSFSPVLYVLLNYSFGHVHNGIAFICVVQCDHV